jgi:hypothetical protein
MQDERAGPQRPGTGEPGVDAALAGPGERPGTGEPGVDAALAGPGERPGTGEPGVDAALAGPGERPGTGEPRVDAALAGLDELPGLPVTEHAAVFDQVHRRLREVLGELDTGPDSAGPRAAGEAAPPPAPLLGPAR